MRTRPPRSGEAAQSSEADRFAANVLPIVDAIRASGISSLAGVADALNARGLRSVRGGKWHISVVQNLLARNLAGHLIAVANACEEWMDDSRAPNARPGMTDTLQLAREALDALPTASGERGLQLASIFAEIEALLNGALTIETLSPALKRLTEKAAKAARDILPTAGNDDPPDLVFWIGALSKTAGEHNRDRLQVADAPQVLKSRLKGLADTAREMALAMDFAFLLDPERKLLSIGYSPADNRLDPSCYDLLASEARLASLFAIAKGDVSTRHWLRLGRAATPLGNGSALISWSGSMFEYLMPSLVMRAPVGSLLEQTNRLVVERQESYGRSLGVPWGVSESAYSARDLEFTYQYSNFGVPGLGLKRGLSENVVIAPMRRASRRWWTRMARVRTTPASRRWEQAAATASMRRLISRVLDFPKARTSRSSATSWPIIKA